MPNYFNNTDILGKDTKIVVTVLSSDVAINELGTKNGDLDFAEPTENIVFAINRRLLSSYYELVRHPEYGGSVKSMVSSIMTPSFIGLANVLLRQEIFKDPRVRSIENLNIRIDSLNRTFFIYYSITTITGQNIKNKVVQINIPS